MARQEEKARRGDDPPAKIRFIKADDSDLTAVIPGVLGMKHFYTRDFSVAIYHVAKGRGNDAPVSPHSHGEEAAVVLSGSGTITTESGEHYPIGPGDVFVIPAGVEHWGTFDNDEELLLVSIVTPPRTELGPEGAVPYFPLGEQTNQN